MGQLLKLSSDFLAHAATTAINGFTPMLITPHRGSSELHDALIERERVHKIKNKLELETHRLGHINPERLLQGKVSNRLGFAITTEEGVQAVIYAHLCEQSQLGFEGLPGNMDEILSTRRRKIWDPDTIVFYSISRIGESEGAGRILISSVQQVLKGVPIQKTTLSPFRDFDKWLDGRKISTVEPEEHKLELALERLINRGDAVQRFHMGNGAVVGDVKHHVNSPDSIDARTGLNIGVNYAYGDPDVTKVYEKLFKQGKIIPMADHLYDRLTRGQRPFAEKVYAQDIFPFIKQDVEMQIQHNADLA